MSHVDGTAGGMIPASSGSSYLLDIEAQAIPDYQCTSEPFVNGLPAAFADAATAQFTP